MSRNLILCTDSYKPSHYLQYPPGMDGLYSYFESRGGKYSKTVFFGLQIILEKYLKNPITQADIDEAAEFFKAHGEPFNREGWEYILNKHGGYIPVVIKAPEEGSVIPVHNVLMTVESTDPKVAWVANYIETVLVRLWYPITVATLSWYAKRTILQFLLATSDDPVGEIPFKLHDFGGRGASSGESAAIGGAAHLVNFMGSDTVEAIRLLNRVHNGGKMSAFSIPAAEHSTITAWGKEHELDAYENMLDQFAKPGAILACVSDSYDLWNAIDHLWGEKLRQKIVDSKATLVVRPDSGHPPTIVVECLKALEAKFGVTRNAKGYKVLNNVRVIQGDGINPQSIRDILDNVAAQGFSASNVAFGMGGGLLQQVDRDTCRFAFKASAVHFPDRGWVNICKDPVTDPGKRSKSGRVHLYELMLEGYRTLPDNSGWHDMRTSAMREYYHNGTLAAPSSLEDIRARAMKELTFELKYA